MRRVEDDRLASLRAHRLAGQAWEVLFDALWGECRATVTPRRAALFAGHLRRALTAWEWDGSPGDPRSLLAILSRERPRARRGRPRGSGRGSPAQVFVCHWWLAKQLQRATRRGANPLDALREAWEDAPRAVWEDVAPVPFPEQAARDLLQARRPLAETIEGILAVAELKPTGSAVAHSRRRPYSAQQHPSG